MYERNAIILERYFDKMFGYDFKNSIKTNFLNYCELIEALERYKNITEEEEEIIIDYDLIANKIRDIQNKQQELNKENLKYQQERESIFDNIDDDANILRSKLDIAIQNIQDINVKIKENAINYINVIAEFNEKSLIRSNCGKNRRNIEFKYNNILNETLDTYSGIDAKVEQLAKQFNQQDTTAIEEELKKTIQENGKKEKIPFNEEAIQQAIKFYIGIQKRETEILSNAYEKTAKLFGEIKNNKLKIDMHKRVIIDSKAKQDFIMTVKDYLVQFLDNERLAAVNGENEYNQLMKEACKNLRDDFVQINNLYTLLLKEISKKSTKKMYNELYKIEYLEELKKKAEDFEVQIKKLKLPVAIINPNYWRVEGMEKIYNIFSKCVTENYNRDLSEFLPAKPDEKKEVEVQEETVEDAKEKTTDNENTIDIIQNNNQKFEAKKDERARIEDVKSQIDRKIDMILGLTKDERKEEVNRILSERTDNKNYYELDNYDSEEEDNINNEEDDEDDGDAWSYNYTEDDEKWDEDEESDEIENDDNEDDDAEWNDEDASDEEENDDVVIEDSEEPDTKGDYEEDEWDYEDNNKTEDEEEDDDEWNEEENSYTEDEEDDDWDDEDDSYYDEENEDEDEEDDEDDENEEDDEDDENSSSDLNKSKGKERKQDKRKDNKKAKHLKKSQDEYKIQDNDSEDVDLDIWGNSINKKGKAKDKKEDDSEQKDDWGDEYVQIDKKQKKKKGFFKKFIK